MPTRKTVLVLCTGNSCRSQMAEVILNHDLGDKVRAISAGTRPQPKVADGAIEALKLAGSSNRGLVS
jgi:arsenate reductase